MNDRRLAFAIATVRNVSLHYDAPPPYSRQDLFQAAFLSILETEARDPVKFKGFGWMGNRAHWAIRSEIKRLQPFGRTGEEAKIPFTPETVSIDATNDPRDQLRMEDRSMESLEAEELLERLTPRQGQVATLEAQGYRPVEVASMLGVTRSAVCNQMKEARKVTLMG